MKKIAILGGGISGYGSAILAKKEGFDVFLSDMGAIEPKFRERLDEWKVEYEEGRHTESRILDADEVVKSPGIPDSAPIVQKLVAAGIPIISEIEFAGRYTNARTICITGSNGKTTTTTLTHRILVDAGFNVGLGGNIGESFAYQVATQQHDWYVLELSSFQLDGMRDFRADIAVLMNITPDHLDRYGYSFDAYAASKMGIVRNQRPTDTFIYCADDPKTAEMVDAGRFVSRRLPFSVRIAPSQGARLVREDGSGGAGSYGGTIRAKFGTRRLSLAVDKMQIRGIHNIYNAMAAGLAAMAAGVAPAVIARTIESFEGVEHRLQPVGSLDGVEYINDSKATNVDSVWYALESMTRPVVWIAGGTDKGNDYEPLMEFAPRIKALVCMGVDNAKLVRAFKDRVSEIRSTDSLEAAMGCAREIATPGDVVLLSPACASFDLFKNYEERGRLFAEWVQKQLRVES